MSYTNTSKSVRRRQRVRLGRIQRRRRLFFETLESRQLLAVDILGFSSTLGNGTRFIAGGPAAPLPIVTNQYTASVADTPDNVTFELGGAIVTDNDGSNGWSAAFDMSRLTSAGNDMLVIRAYNNNTLADTFADSVNLTVIPAWLTTPGTTYDASFDSGSGYHFDVTVSHVAEQFDTPDSWNFRVGGVSILDLSNKRTAFTIQSKFGFDSTLAGDVSPAGSYSLVAEAVLLGEPLFQQVLTPAVTGTIPIGPSTIGHFQYQGNIDWAVSGSIALDDDLRPAGGSIDVSMTPDVTFSWDQNPVTPAIDPLVAVSIPVIPELPFVAQADLKLFASGTLKAAREAPFFRSVLVAGGSDLLRIDQVDLSPEIELKVTGEAGLEGFYGVLGSATLAVDATLTQGVQSQFSNGQWQALAAPGSLTLTGRTYGNLLGFGIPEDQAETVFHWSLANWDFLAPGQRDLPPYEAGVTPNGLITGLDRRYSDLVIDEGATQTFHFFLRFLTRICG